MDHTSHIRLIIVELMLSVLEGATIYGSDDEDIGSVSHVHGTGPDSQVAIDVGGSPPRLRQSLLHEDSRRHQHVGRCKRTQAGGDTAEGPSQRAQSPCEEQHADVAVASLHLSQAEFGWGGAAHPRGR